MSEEQLKAFLEAVRNNADLQNQLKAAGDLNAVVAIADAAGFVITAEELERAQAEPGREIYDWELEAVAGGGASMPSLGGNKNTDTACPLMV